MILYALIAVITIFLACLVRPDEKTEYEKAGNYSLGEVKAVRAFYGYTTRRKALNVLAVGSIFTVLTALAALRLEVGNDYGTYVVTCHEIFQRGYVVTEPGYNFVVRVLYTLSGKEDYLLMFGVFGAAIVAVFLKVLLEQTESFSFAFFVFMTMGFYYRSFNTVRYYFALALATFALRYLVNITWEGTVKFFAVILFAALFHKSVLAVIPMYIIARFPWKKWALLPLCIFGAVAAFFHEQIMVIALKLYPSYNNTVFIEETHTITENAAPVLGCLFVIVLCIYCYHDAVEDGKDNRMYLNMNIMAVVLYLSCFWMPLVTRFAYYLTTCQILLLPNLVCSIRDEKKKNRVAAAVILFCILYFMYFMTQADKEGFRILPYKSWLFYEHRWLNQTDTF
ncbi:MAG: EpsG family protein [Butyrivibrio sp.]|nr:EpsG family protein [Butyrivibrio sp.]